jgi:hypothetical protein
MKRGWDGRGEGVEEPFRGGLFCSRRDKLQIFSPSSRSSLLLLLLFLLLVL